MILSRTTICLILLCIGLLHGFYLQHDAWVLPSAWIKMPIPISGKVISIPKVAPYGQSFLFHVDSIRHTPIDTRFKLYWSNPPPDLKPGSRWQIIATLKPPHGLKNPAGFNYARYLQVHGVSATGGVVRRKPYRRLSHTSRLDPITWRADLFYFLQKKLAQSPLLGVLEAISLGEKSKMTRSDWSVLQRTGTSHLVAISGLHVGLVSLLVYGLVSVLWRLIPGAVLFQPAPKVAAIAAVIAAVFYALLAGLTLPTQRAVIMLVSLLLGELSGREVPLFWRVLYAFSVILALEPLAILSVSFWLSFIAVAWIGFLLLQHPDDGKLKRILRIHGGIALGLMPISLYCFQGVSLLSVPANLIAIPVVSWAVVPCCLMGSVFFFLQLPAVAHCCFSGSEWVLHYLWIYLKWLAHFPWVMLWYSVNSLVVVCVLSLGVILLLSHLRWMYRLLGLVCLGVGLLCRPAHPEKHQLWVSVLDMGQGLSVVLETAHHVLVYDAGPKSMAGFDAGAAVVLPYLRYRHISQIDTLLISHKDMDHRGGAYSLLKAMAVRQLLTSATRYFRHWSPVRCRAGQQWEWDGVQFSVLWPSRLHDASSNDRSCVLHVQVGAQAVLLTGDIESTAESALVHRNASLLRATWLIAPHHGSRTSSTLSFVRAVQPRHVVFSSGFYNHYHLPSPSVVARYRRLGIQTFNTANDGAVFFSLQY